MKPKPKIDSHTVRVRTATLDRLRHVVGEIVQRGWSSVGASRDDQPLPGTVIDQGLVMLEAKLKAKRG